MEQYILKYTGSGQSYRLYSGTTLVSDADLTTMFSTAGSAYFSFDFDGGTPSTDGISIIDSSDLMVMNNTFSSSIVEENKNFKGTWLASATAFDTFSELSGKSLDESQVSFLMKKIKEPVGTSRIENEAVTNAKIASNAVATANLFDGSVTGAANSATLVTGSKIALDTVGTPNLRDSAVTAAKIASGVVPTITMTTTDPGEGVALAANSFIGVYE